MKFCPECGCQLEFTSGVIMCTNCNYSECNCSLCSSQDEIVEVQTVAEEIYSNNMELKGETNNVEQAD
jgi:hypothetical protein